MRVKATTITTILVIMMTATPFFASHAQTDKELKAAKQDVLESLDNLLDVKGAEDLGGELRLQKEMEARKLALEKILDFSVLETKSAIAQLEAVKDITVEYVELRSQLLDGLKKALETLADWQMRLQDTGDLEAIRDFATEYKEWRESFYSPLLGRVIDFISVFYGRNILKMAETRFEKISADLRKLKSSKVIKTEILEPMLNEAGKILKEARGLYLEALALLLETKDDRPSVRAALENMITKIKDTYVIFLEMSGLIKKMIGK